MYPLSFLQAAIGGAMVMVALAGIALVVGVPLIALLLRALLKRKSQEPTDVNADSALSQGETETSNEGCMEPYLLLSFIIVLILIVLAIFLFDFLMPAYGMGN